LDKHFIDKEEEFLKSYDENNYQRPSVTNDIIIFTTADKEEDNLRKVAKKGMQVILIKRDDYPYKGNWALPGGFVDINESLDMGAKRKLKEKTGIDNVYTEQLYTFGDVHRDTRTRVISVGNLALVEKEIIKFEAGVYRTESIKVAEAAKLIENCQRDVNIAFMNELSMIFNKMNIDTKAVIDAAGSKWNFIKMNPGLVGGHCIGVDPYYLIHRAKEIGLESKVIAAGRKINDGMAKYVAENTVKSLIKANKRVKEAKVAVLGITFKEDCPDTRNTKVVDIIKELKEYEVEVVVTDPVANKNELREEYGLELKDIEDINSMDAVILAVSHSEYRNMNINDFNKLFCINDVLDEVATEKEVKDKNVFIDVKGIVDKDSVDKDTFVYWRL